MKSKINCKRLPVFWLSLFWVANYVSANPATFVDSGQLLETGRSDAAALGDMDADGDLDVFIVTSGNNRGNKIWLNDGTGIFIDSGQSLRDFSGGSTSYDVGLKDLDGDGDLDAFVANDGRSNAVWLNDGGSVFTDSGQFLGSSRSVGVAVADFDGDGDSDAFVVNRDNQPGKLYLNDGAAVFTDSGQALGSEDSYAITHGDVDGDGDIDVVIANAFANKLWLNDGVGLFTDSGQALGNTVTGDVTLVDIDNDGDLDLFELSDFQDSKVWKNNGSGTFALSQTLNGFFGLSVEAGDLDNDGDQDLFITRDQPYGHAVWLNNGSGNFFDSGQTFGGFKGHGLALGDVDSDGDLDAIVTNSDNQPNQLWLNQTFSPAPTCRNQVLVSPSVLSIDPQLENTVDVILMISGTDDLYGLQASINFNGNLLSVSNSDFGDFFDPLNRLEIGPSHSIGNWNGSISLRQPASTVTGAGTFATITFDVANTTSIATLDGTALFTGLQGITFDSCLESAEILIDNGINALPGQGLNSSVQVNIPEIDGSNITYTPGADIGVTIVNLDTGARLNFTSDVNGQIAVSDLRAGSYAYAAESGTLISGAQQFTITQSMIDGGQPLNLPDLIMKVGDLNRDGAIDIADFTMLTNRYGTSDGEPRYRTWADLNNDGTVNIVDLTILGSHFNIENSLGIP